MKSKKSPLAMISTGEAAKLRARRILKLSLLAVAIAVLALGYFKLTQPGSFPIKTVKIKGKFPHLNETLFQQKIAPYATGGFFEVNVDEIKQQAMAFPWVYQVDVRKIFPNALTVTITEQTPVAQWNNDGLLNAKGDLFQPPVTTFPPKLPVLYGPKGQYSMMLATFERMDQILKASNLRIIRMDLSTRRSWQIQLNTKLTVILGRNMIWQRLQRFIDIYPKVFAKAHRNAISVDMRYTNGFAVHWQRW